jgi:hypothetical protein
MRLTGKVLANKGHDPEPDWQGLCVDFADLRHAADFVVGAPDSNLPIDG